MARRPSSDESPVSLFPFLSILACIIGALVLLIAALALSQIGTPSDDEAVRRAEEYLVLEKKRSQLEEANKTLLAELGEAGKLQAQLNVLLNEKKKITEVPAIDPAALAPIQASIQDLQMKQKALAEEMKRREEILAKMQTEIARRLEPAKAGFIRVQPSGSGLLAANKPFFVETTKTGISVHTRNGKREFTRGEITAHADMKTFWSNLQADPKAMLIFLIREEGASNFQYAAGQAGARNISYGKIPIPGEGELDLGFFMQ